MEPGDTSSLEPYPGLRAFRKDESDIFFGRDDHISEMIVKLSSSHFLCITGSSGCGKSSLIRAVASQFDCSVCMLSLAGKELEDADLVTAARQNPLSLIHI